MNNKYGLICVSKILQEEDAKNSFSFLTKKEFLKTIESESDKKAIKKVEDLIIHNLKLTQKIIGFCRSVNIDHYRLNNSIFGLTQDPSVDLDLKSLPSFELIQEELREVGRSSITNTITLSVQPDIFCKIYDEDDVLCASSADQLNFYGWMLDTMGMQKNYSSPIILHIGNQPEQENHDSAIAFVDKFYEKYLELGDSAKKRIVLKHDDSGFWNAINLFKYFHVYCLEKHGFGFALSYDNLHDACNDSKISGALIEQKVNVGAFYETWGGVVPVFTWAEAMEPGSSKPSADYSALIPDFNYQIKWECEAKNRDKAILKLLKPDENMITEEQILNIVRKKYDDSTDFYNKLYSSNLVV